MKMKEIVPKEGLRVPSAPMDPPMGIDYRPFYQVNGVLDFHNRKGKFSLRRLL